MKHRKGSDNLWYIYRRRKESKYGVETSVKDEEDEE